MNQKCYWTELIGFDRTLPDYGTEDFLHRVSGDIHGVSLLLYTMDYIFLHDGIREERPLPRGACSYCAHPFNDERAIQPWTDWELRDLIATLHAKGLKVLLCVFDMYSYFGEDGEWKPGVFASEHPEIRWYHSAKTFYESNILVMKRFRDGTPCRDLYISQLTRVLQDYGFDGYHFGDGLSSLRFPIHRMDFTDDIVEQYLTASGMTLPEELSGSCDRDLDKHSARCNYILEHQRYEFTLFVSEWFADFYRRLASALQPRNKQIIFNISWARDPFEAFYRYGMDYAALPKEGISGLMVEDVGSMMPLYSQRSMEGFLVPLEERKYANYDLMLTQMAIKAHVPHFMQWNMTTLKDTMEDWNLIDTAPYELEKLILRRNNTYNQGETHYEHASNGAFYCLSDAIPKEKWDKIKAWEDFAALREITGVMGFTAIWEPSILRAELQEYIRERKPSVNRLLETLTVQGVSIATMVHIEQVEQCKTPLLALRAELYPQESLQRLETLQDVPLVLIGFGNPLRRTPDAVLEEGPGGYQAYFYNCPSVTGETRLDLPPQPIEFTTAGHEDCTWTVPLKFRRPHPEFLQQLTARLDSMNCYPLVLNERDCHLVAYRTGEGRGLMLITNDSYAAEDVRIYFPCKLRSVRALARPAWFRCSFDAQCLTLRINNRAMEIVEFTFDELSAEERKQNGRDFYDPTLFEYNPSKGRKELP